MPTRSRLQVEGFFDPATWTVSYIVLDTGTQQCAIVDSVLDYDPKSGRTSQASADRLIARVRELGARCSGSWRRMCMPTTCRPRRI
jgi:glyoxylase-like metal-dependent hydrolase (beta-lactamase superfamily II)